MAEQDQPQFAPSSSQPQHLQLPESSRIPDALMALVKDSRYIQECKSLFLKVMSTILPRRRHQLLEQESWILASVLCLALGLRNTPHKTTLGMDALGLEFTKNSARWKLVAFTVGALGWAYAFSPHHRELQSTIISTAILPSATNPMDEQLRGLSRREFHERQRQAMLQRANQTASNPATSSNANGSSQSENGAVSARSLSIDSIRQRIESILLTLARVLASAVLAPCEGPHTLPAETHHQQQINAVPGNESVQQAGRWLVKLQLAHFCLTGLYPNWLHRLTGHAMVPSSPSRIHHQPTTARLVGLLLGAQAVAALIQASSSAASHWLVQQRHSQQSSQPKVSPAIVFKSASNNEPSAHHESSICSICKMERTNPSAPSCGHVFCWKCLVQCCSTIRPECPLCRQACRLQDIVALYNYEPSS